MKGETIHMYSSNYNYYPYMQQQPNQSQMLMQGPIKPMDGGLKGHPVSSFEEARAQTIDFDGSIFYFPDLANKRIYTKQVNIDGTATLNMYELKEIPMVSNSSYVTREEFNAAMATINQLLMPTQMPEAQKEQLKTF